MLKIYLDWNSVNNSDIRDSSCHASEYRAIEQETKTL